jgi:hypothetical protein
MAIREVNDVPLRTIQIPFPATTAFAIGDLLYMNAGVAAKASARADLGSVALNQADFRPLFLGINADQRLASETSTGNDSRRLVVVEGVFDCDCDSATFEFGDHVGIARSATPNNELQKVVAVTSPFLAIGRVVKREPSAVTKVRCLLSALQFGYFFKGNPASLQANGTHLAADADTTLTVAQVAAATRLTMTPGANPRKLIMPSEAPSAGLTLLVVNLAGATNAIQVRNSADNATVGTIPATKAGIVLADGTTWRVMVGA